MASVFAEAKSGQVAMAMCSDTQIPDPPQPEETSSWNIIRGSFSPASRLVMMILTIETVAILCIPEFQREQNMKKKNVPMADDLPTLNIL